MASANPFETQQSSLMSKAFAQAAGTMDAGNKPAGAANPFDAKTSQLAAGSQYQATTKAFDESKGVAGRVDGIIKSGSPLMEAAQTRAAQQASGRGLLNSTMAIQAGQQAVLDSAAAIAGKDADLFQQQELANQQALNTAAGQNAQLRTQVGVEGMKLGETARQFDTGQANNESQFTRQLGLEDKKQAEQTRQFEAGLGLEKQKLEQDAGQFARSIGLEYDKLSEAQRSEVRRLALEQQKLAESSRQFDTEQAGVNDRFGRELGEKGRQFDTEQSNAVGKLNTELASRERIAQMDNQTRTAIANLDSSSRERVATLENEWRIELSRNEKLAGAWGTMMDNINRLQGNKDLDPGTRQQLIQQNMDMFAGYANFAKKLSDNPVDVSDLLDFTTTGSGSAGSGWGAGAGDKPNVPPPESDEDRFWREYNSRNES